MIQMLSTYFESLRSDERGQGLVEYALIISLVAVVLIAALNALAVDIGGVFTSITTAL
jgi:pilus assembly protein Flp/PilA